MKSGDRQQRTHRVKYKSLLRAIVLAAIAVLVFLIGKHFGVISEIPKFAWNGKAVLRGVMILLIMFAAESVLLFLLSLTKPKKNRVRTLISLTKNILRYTVILAAICVILTIFNVDIVTILAGLGILALIIGFGAESLIADIVTGMFILIDNQYNIGDIIEVDGFRGAVTEINVRSTVLTDAGGNVKIINNSDMKNILNRSDNTSKAIAEFPIPYEVNLVELEGKLPAMLQEIHDANQPLMRSVPKYVGVERIDDSALVLKFVVDVSEVDIYAGMRALNRDLLLGMSKLGVNVPYQRIDMRG